MKADDNEYQYVSADNLPAQIFGNQHNEVAWLHWNAPTWRPSQFKMIMEGFDFAGGGGEAILTESKLSTPWYVYNVRHLIHDVLPHPPSEHSVYCCHGLLV